ncbi:Cell cycle checkpoint protein RAD1 [Bienertia sinuspersici]
MSSSSMDATLPDLVCQLDNVQGFCRRSHFCSLETPSGFLMILIKFDGFHHFRMPVIELSEHGIVLIVEETGCLQAKVYLQKELFVKYEYTAEARPRFGVSLGLLVDCLNTFSVPGHSSMIEFRYPGPDMQLLLKSIDSLDACIYAEIRTRIPDTMSWDYNFEPMGTTPLSFTVKSSALKEAIDDLEWPGSSIKITVQPNPPSVTLRGEGHGDLQIDFLYYVNTDLLAAFNCDREVSHRYKYKFLRAATSNIPSSVVKDNRGSKITVGRGGILKVQHLVSVARATHPHIDSAGYQPPSRIAYIEFFVKPEEVDDD